VSGVEGEDPCLRAYGYGNDVECLSDETFSPLRCDFCGEDIDAAGLLPRDTVDRITTRCWSRPRRSCSHPGSGVRLNPLTQDLLSFGNACQQTEGED
jgi:hypothetical protein